MKDALINSCLPGIIVLGGHVQALGILRILGRQGIAGVVFDDKKMNIARHSKFCYLYKYYETEALLPLLLKLRKDGKFKNWVIFPTNDFHVKILSINKKQLEPYFRIGVDNWESVNIFYNKRNTYELAKKIGIPIAKTFFPGNLEELSTFDITYPCIIKPAVMYDFYKQVKKKVFLCRDDFELRENYNLALKFIPSKEIIVQEVIKGSSKNQFSACYLFLNKKPYVYLTACRMRQHPLDFGNATTYAETIEIPILHEYGQKILTEANYNGICEIEFKLDDTDNQYKFLEVNARSWKWHSISNKAETPFFKTYFDYLIESPIKATTGFRKASFIHVLTDLPVNLQLLFRGCNYWRRRIRPIEHAVWAYDDPFPWLFEKLYFPIFLFTR